MLAVLQNSVRLYFIEGDYMKAVKCLGLAKKQPSGWFSWIEFLPTVIESIWKVML